MRREPPTWKGRNDVCTTALIVRGSLSSSVSRAASQIYHLLLPSQLASAGPMTVQQKWQETDGIYLCSLPNLMVAETDPRNLPSPHISNSETSSQEDSVIEAAWVSVSMPTPLGGPLVCSFEHRPRLIGDMRADNRTVGLPWPFPVLPACPTLTVISPVWPTWGAWSWR